MLPIRAIVELALLLVASGKFGHGRIVRGAALAIFFILLLPSIVCDLIAMTGQIMCKRIKSIIHPEKRS